MRDHVRILGGLYVGWAAVQAIGLATMSSRWLQMQPRGGLIWVGIALLVLLVIFYAVVGALLWRRDLGARGVAIALAVVALLSLPVGTAIGAYGLWVLLRRTTSARAHA